jgi:hypothetical protein
VSGFQGGLFQFPLVLLFQSACLVQQLVVAQQGFLFAHASLSGATAVEFDIAGDAFLQLGRIGLFGAFQHGFGDLFNLFRCCLHLLLLLPLFGANHRQNLWQKVEAEQRHQCKRK